MQALAWIVSRARLALLLLPFRFVTLPRLVVHRIEAGQFHPFSTSPDDPFLIFFVLQAFLGNGLDQRLRDDHGSIVIRDDDIAGKNRTAAASDRLVPTNEGQSVDRRRRSNARTPERQAGFENARSCRA